MIRIPEYNDGVLTSSPLYIDPKKEMMIIELIITQLNLRDVENVLAMAKFVKSGGIFSHQVMEDYILKKSVHSGIPVDSIPSPILVAKGFPDVRPKTSSNVLEQEISVGWPSQSISDMARRKKGTITFRVQNYWGKLRFLSKRKVATQNQVLSTKI
jgi:hypothetical protein